jgi:hypothetical protein
MDSPSQRSAAPPGLVQAPSRRLALEATALAARAGFAMRGAADGPVTLAADDRITGEAGLPRDRLGRSGAADEAGMLPLAIRPLPEGNAARMLLMLGHGGESDGFHADLWLPAEVFAALKRDAEAGRAGHLALSATTNLWIAESEREAPDDAGVTWLLGREEDGAAQTARGLVERVSWSADPPAMPQEAAAVPEAEAPEETDEPESVAELLTRLNWSLKQIALVLIFLLIVVALK